MNRLPIAAGLILSVMLASSVMFLSVIAGTPKTNVHGAVHHKPLHVHPVVYS